MDKESNLSGPQTVQSVVGIEGDIEQVPYAACLHDNRCRILGEKFPVDILNHGGKVRKKRSPASLKSEAP